MKGNHSAKNRYIWPFNVFCFCIVSTPTWGTTYLTSLEKVYKYNLYITGLLIYFHVCVICFYIYCIFIIVVTSDGFIRHNQIRLIMVFFLFYMTFFIILVILQLCKSFIVWLLSIKTPLDGNTWIRGFNTNVICKVIIIGFSPYCTKQYSL